MSFFEFSRLTLTFHVHAGSYFPNNRIAHPLFRLPSSPLILAAIDNASIGDAVYRFFTNPWLARLVAKNHIAETRRSRCDAQK